jgi:ribonuclease R
MQMTPPGDDLLGQLRSRLEHPADLKDLLRLLKVPREARPAFRRRLKALVAEGVVVKTRSGLFGLPDLMDQVVGRLRTSPAGHAIVETDATVGGLPAQVFVAGPHLGGAMHGDRVEARIERRRAGERPEGRVLRVLERGSATAVGRLDEDPATGMRFVVPFDRRLVMDVLVPRGEERGASAGEMVTVEITRWPTATRGPVGRVVEVLGRIDAPGVDTQIIIRKHGIQDVHGEAALAEARRLGTTVRPADIHGRTDFRAWPTVTIDGEHARDFDDAITLEVLPNGHYWLGVHIADVSHYVKEGSALDEEARERGTSVYFPERAVHMFPADLATGLCSLNPHVDRLVQSCLMEVDGRGHVVRHEVHDGVINSGARMTYADVNAILTDPDTVARRTYAELVPLFERMQDLFEILNGRRRRRGSIDFDLPEPEVLLDAQGLIEDIIPAERNVAHRLIEEFMLLANETVAAHLDGHGAPTLYRVHEAPDPVKVAEFEEFVASLGYSLNAPIDGPKPRHFQKLVDRIKGTPEEKPIAFLVLRTMQKARYDPSNLGHFGLAATCYTHFTSPIRRYPDLVVHRALRALRHGQLGEERVAGLVEELPGMARHASERERRADDAERELVQWKKVRFMADKVGDEFDGYITGVTPFGLFVELTDHFVEGLVHVSSMADDYYRYLERGHTLRGENTHRVYRLGDHVRVQVVRVDQERRQIDLGLVEILERMRASAKGSGPRRSPSSPKAAPRSARRTRTPIASPRARKNRPGRRERQEGRGRKR